MQSFLRDPKRLIATVLAGAVGLLVLVDLAAIVPGVDALAVLLVNWAALLTAIALVIGVLNVVATHIRRVSRREPDWGYSVVLLLALLLVVVVGTVVGPVPNPQGGVDVTLFPQSVAEQPIRDLFRAVYAPLATSLLALMTFFALSAALRAAGRRTAETLVILVVASLVLLTRLPQVETLPMVGETLGWLNAYVSQAGARALLIGTSIGALVASVRVLLGFDQPYLDR